MGMQITETARPERGAGRGSRVLEALISILLSFLLWQTVFWFLNGSQNPLPTSSAQYQLYLLISAAVPLFTSLLCLVPWFRERQVWIGTIAADILFAAVAIFHAKDFVTRMQSIGAPKADLLLDRTGLLYLLAVILLFSSIVSDDLLVRRRAYPQLATLLPIALFLILRVPYPKGTPRIWFALYLAVLVFSFVFTLGKEKPFRSRQINMGLSCFLAAVVFLSIFLPLTHRMDNVAWINSRSTYSQQERMGKKMQRQQSQQPRGDEKKARQAPTGTGAVCLIQKDGRWTRDFYLRGFCGEYHSSGQWNSLGRHEADRKDAARAEKGGLQPEFAVAQIRSARGQKPQEKMVITWKASKDQRGSQAMMLPYEADPRGLHLEKTSIQRTEPVTRLSGSYQVSLSLYQPIADSGLRTSTDARGTRWEDAFASYNRYVGYKNKNDLALSRDDRELLAMLPDWHRSGDSDPASVLAEIRSCFRDFHYQKGSLSNKGDLNAFVRNKSGNNYDFATLGTLMFRRAGIPARYREGYLIPQGTRPKDGITTVTEKQAHMWVEVYLENVGWVPVEVKTSERKQQSPQQKKETQKSQNGTRKKTQKRAVHRHPAHARRIWIWILAALALLGAGAAAFLFWRRRHPHSDGSPEKEEQSAVFRGYVTCLRHLRKLGYPVDPQHPENLIPYLGEDYAAYLSFIYRERYGPDRLNAEGRKWCEDFVRRTLEETPPFEEKTDR